MDTNSTLLICECNSTEHQIIISYDKEENQAYCHIHLTNRNFWSRLKNGLKFIFGYHCRFGHWDEFIFKPEHADILIFLAQRLDQSEFDFDSITNQRLTGMEGDRLSRKG